MRVILGVEHHDLGWIDVRNVVHRIVEFSTVQLVPVSRREPIRIPKRFADVRRIARVGSLGLLAFP